MGGWVRLGVAAVVAAQSMIFGLAINLSPPEGMTRAILHGALALSAVVVFALAGWPLARRCWSALLSGRIIFDQLFLLGILAAFGASVHCSLTGVGHVYYEIVAILLAIYTFGGLITEARRREVLSAAGNLGSEFATCEAVSADGSLRRVAVEEIEEGEIIWVRSGGAVCIDGTVVEGISFVQEAALTGEPFPVVKRPGDDVVAGSYAVEGGLKVRAVRTGRGRGLDVLLEALREAQGRPSRLQREADKLAAWFLPVVVTLAVGTFAWWTAVSGWQQALFNSLAVILVACPCAMGIATPVAIWSALSAFVREGLRPKDGDLVEKLATVTTVVFDKTGTLGEEAMEIVDFVVADGFDRSTLRRMAAVLENASDHPVARAFRRTCDGGHVEGEIRLLVGAGIEGRVDGHLVRIGNAGVIGESSLTEMAALTAQTTASTSATREIFLVVDGQPAGVAVLRETLRSGALEALANFEEMGIRCEVMTGDRPESAAALDLPNVRAGLTPADKARLVRELVQKGESVLFVGDGINDSAAMGEAHAAVAIQSGTALAAEAADAVLPGNQLRSLPKAVARARQSVRAIRGNLLFAACYNAIGVSLAAMGFLHPVAAALIMLASSFTVTWRALRNVEEESLPPVPHLQTQPA